MRVKVGDVLAAVISQGEQAAAIDTLMALPLAPQMALRMALLRQQLDGVRAAYEQAVQGLLRRYGAPAEDHPDRVFIAKENVPQWQRDVQALEAYEVDLAGVEPVAMAELFGSEGGTIQPFVLARCHWLFSDFEGSEAPQFDLLAALEAEPA